MGKLCARSASKKMTASPKRSPFFVPPNINTSTPASTVNSVIGQFNAAAALDIRAPSITTFVSKKGTKKRKIIEVCINQLLIHSNEPTDIILELPLVYKQCHIRYSEIYTPPPVEIYAEHSSPLKSLKTDISKTLKSNTSSLKASISHP
jgi:hypothetical protein